MPSTRTNPYHLYLVSLKFPGNSAEKASWGDGNPANVLASLLTAGAFGSFGAGAASPGEIENAGGLDDIPGSTVLLDGAWTVSLGGGVGALPVSPGAGSCPNADEPRTSPSPAAAVDLHARLVNWIMASAPRANAGPSRKLELLSTRVVGETGYR